MAPEPTLLDRKLIRPVLIVEGDARLLETLTRQIRPTGLPVCAAIREETKIDHRLPDTVVANLVVIGVQPETSVAIVTHVSRELQKGDPFRPADNEQTSFEAAQSAPLNGTQWTERTLSRGTTPQPPPPSPRPARGWDQRQKVPR